jgi:hypothetical protein
MKFLKKSEVKWLLPYLEAVTDLTNLDKLKEIRFSTYRKGFPSYHGLIETATFKKDYIITVRVYAPLNRTKPITKLNQETVLCNLAHELAHLTHWNDYTVERFLLETEIYAVFGRKLAELGYEIDRNKT